jgi:hypothetical protein
VVVTMLGFSVGVYWVWARLRVVRMDRTRSCRHSVVTAADCQRRKSRGDTPKLHPGIQGRGR